MTGRAHLRSLAPSAGASLLEMVLAFVVLAVAVVPVLSLMFGTNRLQHKVSGVFREAVAAQLAWEAIKGLVVFRDDPALARDCASPPAPGGWPVMALNKFPRAGDQCPMRVPAKAARFGPGPERKLASDSRGSATGGTTDAPSDPTEGERR